MHTKCKPASSLVHMLKHGRRVWLTSSKQLQTFEYVRCISVVSLVLKEGVCHLVAELRATAQTGSSGLQIAPLLAGSTKLCIEQ